MSTAGIISVALCPLLGSYGMWEGVWLEPEWYAELDRLYSIFDGLKEYCRSHGIGLKQDRRIAIGAQLSGLTIKLNPETIDRAVWYLIHELAHFESGDYLYTTEERFARNELYTMFVELIIRDRLRLPGELGMSVNFDLLMNIPEVAGPVKLLLEKIARYDGGVKK